MHLICSYCGDYIKEKEPFDVEKKTHGICQECFEPLLSQHKGLSHDEYLETFDVPVLVADSRGRIAAANQAALEMLDRPVERVFEMLGGEALECRYSRLPGGCGKTIHCETCTLRNLVLKSMERQVTLSNQFVTIDTEKGIKSLMVTVIYYHDFIHIVIEDCRIVENS